METEISSTAALETRCCIAGGGPAGMMLGFLLARAGVDVVVLEKHADFLRDFRGDTIHPSTLELMYELGILEEFLRRPHQELPQVGVEIEGCSVTVADFSHLPTHSKFIAFMPQWDFLNFLAEKGKGYPQFHLRMESEVVDLIERDNRVAGVRVRTPHEEFAVHADLVVGADGRRSTVRNKAGLQVLDLDAPIDVLWMRLSRQPDDPKQTLGRFQAGRTLITLDRGDYWQCAYVIPKGSFAAIRASGLSLFHQDVARLAPFLVPRMHEIADWDQVSLLSVAVDRLREWCRPGLLCIGDAAHAMSPVGGVGINLAVQDAVATANLLAQPLRTRTVGDDHLRRVQQRRNFPTRMTQAIQVFIHKNFLNPTAQNRKRTPHLPLPLRLLERFPSLRRFPARIVGMGFRPEHIRTPDAGSQSMR